MKDLQSTLKHISKIPTGRNDVVIGEPTSKSAQQEQSKSKILESLKVFF